jgi:sugar O-acyltransferase (sialic acid O-acetyltransferase NeuD family)
LLKIGVIGAGGQARVVSEILHYDAATEILAYVDRQSGEKSEEIDGISVLGEVLGDHSVLMELMLKGMEGFIVAVGDNQVRMDHFNKCLELGIKPVNAIHPGARIAHNSKLGKGDTIAVGAIICSQANIGNNVIINTGVIIDHECIIADHVHIAPGTIVAGRTEIGRGSFIGAGTVVIDKIQIGKNVTIGAGSVVLQNIPDNRVAVGAPAKIIR